MWKWREMSGVVCDKKMASMTKAAVYKPIISHVLMNVNQTRALRKAEQNFLERTEMRMFRWMTGIGRIEKIRNEEIKARENISEKISEARLRRLGHVERKSKEAVVTRTWKMEVVGHRRKT